METEQKTSIPSPLIPPANTPAPPAKSPQGIVPPTRPAPKKDLMTGFFLGAKGLLIAVIIVIIAIVVGISVMFGFGAADQYQGMVKKIEKETEMLKN